MNANRAGYEYLSSLQFWDGRKGFSLDSMRLIMLLLGNPQDKVRSIHVAGTNGKGSTSLMIAAILGAHGYKVGLTISPHLETINERFLIDGLKVSDDWINEHALQIKEVASENDIKLSYHEALTAIAFLGFAASNLDFMVIETGLGGRLDASNVIKCPVASVITSIGLDHTEILGDTVEKITLEKAGIIKEDSQVVIGPLSNSCLQIVKDIAAKNRAGFYSVLDTGELKEQIGKASLSLKGSHQTDNATLALKVAQLLGLDISQSIEAIQDCFWPARLEEITYNGRSIIIDCAHNSHGTQSLVNFLNQNTIRNVHLIYGTLDTKDWLNSLSLLAPFISTFSYFEPDSARALSESTIKEASDSLINSASTKYYFAKKYDYFINHINSLSPNLPILLTGSIYLVGTLRAKLNIAQRPLWKRGR